MKKVKVAIIESEAGWGQRIDEIKIFKNKGLAVSWANRYNKKYNNKKEVPSWYMFARIIN